MSSRLHYDGTKIRYRVSTIGTNLSAYVEWGVEVERERRYTIRPWYAPWTTTHEWRRSGSPPIFYFDAVEFFRGDGSIIPWEALAPEIIDEKGYRKIRTLYIFAELGDGPDPVEGHDARMVENVKASYTWNGGAKTLEHDL